MNKIKLMQEFVYIVRYSFSGLINTIIGLLIIFLLMHLNFSPFIANIGGYAIGLISSFIFSKKFVFRSNGHFAKEGILFLACFFLCFLLNLFLLYISINIVNLKPMISQIIASIGYTGSMYIMTRCFVFLR